MEKSKLAPSSLKNERCIVFTGGGTGGHIYPGIAVIEALRDRGFIGRIVWIGSGKRLDRDIVEECGIEYFDIPSGKFRREVSFQNLTDIARIFAGYFKAKRILKNLSPRLLFSKGGYVSVPPCFAAAALKIPIITHESDVSPGLATKLNSRKASLILTSWEETATMFPESIRSKTMRVGNPIRSSLLNGRRERGIEKLGFRKDKPILFVLGGSQGAREINTIVLDALPLLIPKFQIVHQTGKALFEEVVAKIPDDAVIRANYQPRAYFGNEIADIYAASDIVAGRAGAGSIWEAASLGKPMVLIPLAGAGTRGDQLENAACAEKAGAAKVIRSEDLSPQTFAEALSDLWDRANFEHAISACYALTRIESAENSAITMTSAEFIAHLIMNKI
jgi:UDP-N-acetylglucosamine--N-acetylmuramyl-(pentapeptide) pyrophosphoryl-undecaprenol N-acetylglucosamine transferase